MQVPVRDTRLRADKVCSRLACLVVVGLLAVVESQAQLVIQRVYTSPQGYPVVVPFSSLVQALDGNFYGTMPAVSYASYPNGLVFRLTPRGVFTALFMRFNGKDPEGPLVLGMDGNLYGTTMSGGDYGLGTLFKVTTNGALQLLHSFSGVDAAYPQFALSQASDGFLYGVTTPQSTNRATIYRASTSGTITVLTNFSPSSYATPSDGLAEGADGWFYGTTVNGSTWTRTVIGSIYKVAPSGTLRTLATFFDNSPTGSLSNQPMCGLTAGPDGLLYGTMGHSLTSTGAGYGSVFSMTTNGVRTTIFDFHGTDGSNPNVRLVLGNDGAFYGQTASGGPHRMGTTFRITTAGEMTVLGDALGNQAASIISGGPPLVQASDGNLYTTAVVSYSAFAYRLVPPVTITRTDYANGLLTLTWNSFVNGAYQVYYKNDAADANWTTLGPVIVATGATTSSAYNVAAAAHRIYKVALLP